MFYRYRDPIHLANIRKNNGHIGNIKFENVNTREVSLKALNKQQIISTIF